MKPASRGGISHLASRLLILPIRFYQGSISPLLPPACRFSPTCSQYAVEAIQLHGPLCGSLLAARRILRCHPWGASGYDPVPPAQEKPLQRSENLVRKAALQGGGSPAQVSVSLPSVPGASAPGVPSVPDVHSHGAPKPFAICSLTPEQFCSHPQSDQSRPCSVGIHPWYIDSDGTEQLEKLKSIAPRPEVIAIGEAGLDSLRGPELPLQISLLKEQIRISEELRKPLVLHLVRAWPELMKLRREMQPSQPWILHGFRGKPTILRQLSDGPNQIYFSIGEKFNPRSVAEIPADRLLLETDESTMPIEDILEKVAETRHISPEQLHQEIRSNILRIFPTLRGCF